MHSLCEVDRCVFWFLILSSSIIQSRIQFSQSMTSIWLIESLNLLPMQTVAKSSSSWHLRFVPWWWIDACFYEFGFFGCEYFGERYLCINPDWFGAWNREAMASRRRWSWIFLGACSWILYWKTSPNIFGVHQTTHCFPKFQPNSTVPGPII